MTLDIAPGHDFDQIIDRRGTGCGKWDKMEALFGVSPDDGIAMWVADMDFAAPHSVREAIVKRAEHGIFGYPTDTSYREAVVGWMKRRHGWEVDPAWLHTTHGLVNGTALCVQAFSEPGDGVILFTPVYHAFHRVLEANKRRIVQSRMVERDGRYEMDLEALAAQLDGSEKMVIFCSPHNPGGRVWSREEIRALAGFCAEHDLILVSDEIHGDLVLPGGPKHLIANLAAPEHVDRIITLLAGTKTFNLAGAMTGGVFIEDPALRQRFAAHQMSVGATPNGMGLTMIEAAYRGGEAWLDDLLVYLGGNRKVFDEGIAAIPGLRSMPLEATYLAWVDFSGTGMSREEFTARVEKEAKIAVNHGPPFGEGGESWLRFNFATPRSRVQEAVERLARAFGDLQ